MNKSLSEKLDDLVKQTERELSEFDNEVKEETRPSFLCLLVSLLIPLLLVGSCGAAIYHHHQKCEAKKLCLKKHRCINIPERHWGTYYYRDKNTDLCFVERWNRSSNVPCTKKVMKQVRESERCDNVREHLCNL